MAVFGPCPAVHIAFYVEELLSQKTESVDMLLSLACAMGLLKSIPPTPNAELFFRPLQNGNLPVFHYTKKHFGIPTLRAKALSVMQCIPAAATALGRFQEELGCYSDGNKVRFTGAVC